MLPLYTSGPGINTVNNLLITIIPKKVRTLGQEEELSQKVKVFFFFSN